MIPLGLCLGGMALVAIISIWYGVSLGRQIEINNLTEEVREEFRQKFFNRFVEEFEKKVNERVEQIMAAAQEENETKENNNEDITCS